jgi:hypothetical protein
MAAGVNAALKIELTGNNLGPAGRGFALTAPGSTIQGLLINGFQGEAIHVNTGAVPCDTTITGNWFGIDATGTTAVANSGRGVNFDNTSNGTVGGTTLAARNFFGGTALGVAIIGGSANKVQGNFIGTNAMGRRRWPAIKATPSSPSTRRTT